MSGRLFTILPKGIYFASPILKSELRYLDFATGSVRTIAPLPGMLHADVTADERWALYPRATMSDVNLILSEIFR